MQIYNAYLRQSTSVCVSGDKKFGVLCFLETPVLRFAFLPYYRRNNVA